MADSSGVPRLWKLLARSSVENGANLLILEGRIGHAAAARVREAAQTAMAAGDGDLLIDLSAVDYLSSAGIKVLEELAAERASRGHALTLRGASPAAKLSIELAGLATAYPDIVEK
jgi:anti-anti-sigma factor